MDYGTVKIDIFNRTLWHSIEAEDENITVLAITYTNGSIVAHVTVNKENYENLKVVLLRIVKQVQELYESITATAQASTTTLTSTRSSLPASQTTSNSIGGAMASDAPDTDYDAVYYTVAITGTLLLLASIAYVYRPVKESEVNLF